MQRDLAEIPGARLLAVVPPALPGGGQFPVEFVIASTAETNEIVGLRSVWRSRPPPRASSRSHRWSMRNSIKRTEIVLDRDKIADLGMNLQQVGRDLEAMVGGNYVNRFNIAGRSYRVIPQVTRLDRLNAEQLAYIHVTGPDGQLIPLESVASLRTTVQPRSLNRFQQLNAVKISGVAIRPLDEALRQLEDEAAAILPDGYRIDYTGESRQLRQEGRHSFLRSAWPWCSSFWSLPPSSTVSAIH